ncbi:phospholipid carrier-dependent glycosyltransferase [Microcoleus sp. FACHB-68]|uniref:phospholipid carrier-dependent glycosyltransferase n=1 Tax=Microcoleus sp. FACHB-68 TaxID=2692826 RepID=UPI0016822E5B|nr:phospholipid carrier-dependent glycosyltransferase [Microcoleus sp. FACHB-68]
MVDSGERKKFGGLPALGLIWLVGALSDRVWFALDKSVPAWDQAEYLTGGLTYWQALQHPLWLNGEWWSSFWMISSKVPPLTYIITAGFLDLFGAGSDQATLINLLFSAILLGSVYGLGTRLFNRQIGLWAAGLCLLLPGLYLVRLDFLLDYPLTAAVTLSFYCLTIWKIQQEKERGVTGKNLRLTQWLWVSAFGICFGLALLVKQTSLFFLFVPVLWVAISAIRRRHWIGVVQLAWSLMLSVLVCGPWYRTNWLLILTGGKRATLDSAMAEGDPALNTLDAWAFYWKDLPQIVSWPLLLVPAVGFLLYWIRPLFNNQAASPPRFLPAIKWLAVFLIGAYLLCSLNINKDSRYVLPYLPVLSLLLAYGLTLWPRRWGKYIRWGTAGTAILLMLLNLWPAEGFLSRQFTQFLSPRAQHYAYLGTEWPHRQVIAEIIQTQPYLNSNLGVLPSTPAINQHNLNYYGALANFQVYARQVGVNLKQVSQDVRSLSWFITKTGDQGSVPTEAQAAIVKAVEQSADFQLKKSWPLPDGSRLKLYHRRVPAVEIQGTEKLTQSPNRLISANSNAKNPNRVQLERVTVPDQAPPGVPMPVTYEWLGSWDQLQAGLVLLTWQSNPQKSANFLIPTTQIPVSQQWLHDHGIGTGSLHKGMPANLSKKEFQVIERMAMLPPPNARGIYTLKATYLNRQTGESYPIKVPDISIKIETAAKQVPAPELDLITQLRILAISLPQGSDALTHVFEEIGRINQYDPIQDYTVQTELAMEHRLTQEGPKRGYAYALALARVLQRDAKGAISALEQVVRLDSQNPYGYAYLAFLHLYDLHPKAAEKALEPAFKINPNLPEIKALRAVAALMQGNLVQFWGDVQTLRNLK